MSFFGTCIVYRRFVIDFTKSIRPLNALIKKEVSRNLPPPSVEAEDGFEDLRDPLVHPPIWALPGAGRELTLDVDASAHQLACTLLQQDDDGKQHPLGHQGRTLAPAERNLTGAPYHKRGRVLPTQAPRCATPLPTG